MRARRGCAPTRPMSSANSRPMRRQCRDGNAPGNIPTPGATQLGQRGRAVVSLHLRTLAREGRKTVTIGRRELLAALGGAATWPLSARAQPVSHMPRVGVLLADSDDQGMPARLEGLRQGLERLGWSDGRNM